MIQKLSRLVLICALFGGLLAGPAQAEKPAEMIPVYSLYGPTFVYNYYSNNSVIHIQNPGSVMVNAVVTAYANNGTPYMTSGLAIPAASAIQVDGTDFPGLPNGDFAFVIASDGPVAAVVETARATGPDRLAAYTVSASLAQTQYFGPFYTGSVLMIANMSSSPITCQANFSDANGATTSYMLSNIAPYGKMTVMGNGVPGLPASFVGLANVTCTGDFTGLLGHVNVGSVADFELLEPLAPGMQSVLPRVLKSVDEGGLRSSQLFFANLSGNAANLTYQLTGGYNGVINLPVNGSSLVDLQTLAAVPNGAMGAWVMADQMIVSGEFTQYPNGSPDHHAADYPMTGVDASTLLAPRVMLTASAFAILSVYNRSTSLATISFTFVDSSGQVAGQAQQTVDAYQMTRLDLRQVDTLPADFSGSVLVSGSGALAGTVDLFNYTPTCDPVSNPQIAIGTTPVIAGVPVTFTASAGGSGPFNYAWSVDTVPQGANDDTLVYTFSQAGYYFVDVTISNACSSNSAPTLNVQVVEDRPDLSSSLKSVNLSSIEAGDILTYTLTLRNTGAAAASAVLTDTLPAALNMRAGSASASLGSLQVAGDTLTWSGAVQPGVPVTIRFGADALPGSIGQVVTNTAELDDGVGNTYLLTASSTYNPGYGLSINGGSLATNQPQVDLEYSWNANDQIEKYRVSNDGGFTGSQTTAWLVVDETNPVYPGWALSSPGGNYLIPRTVYIQFRKQNGTIVGPFQDDIILDLTAPEIVNIMVIPAAGVRVPDRPGAAEVIIQVTASEENSGLKEIQVSSLPSFATYSRFAAQGLVTDIPWTLQAGERVYVRAVDQAGNVSPAVDEDGMQITRLYLPFLRE